MSKMQSSFKNMTVVLGLTAIVMALLLALVNHLTEGPIAAQKEQALAEGLCTVLCAENVNVERVDTLSQDGATYVIYHAGSNGTAIESATTGFGGTLKVLVGFSEEGAVKGYTLLECAETPGLGAKADKWFQQDGKGSIIGRTPEKPLTVSKDGGDVDAITASTITSRAFLKAVNGAYAALKGQTDGETGSTKKVKN